MTDFDQDLKIFDDSCEKIAEGITSANKAIGNLLPIIKNSLQLTEHVDEIKKDVKEILAVLKDVVKKEDLKNEFRKKFRQYEKNQLIREQNRLRFRTNQITFEWLNNDENETPEIEEKFEIFNKLSDKALSDLAKFYDIPELDSTLKEEKKKALSIFLGFY
ncbi:hypothetical protein BpHYR1_029616 [Brachionus plicatilis]|uniref:Uncharacterized protein n=1 Tax=Brachionus plicatilis TaxID=10195 RepID=A0A3M7RCN9_BRAPC|nr:hypothetical protein BpHYR1_029616 [Brachionus plicatilis]